MTHYVKLTHYEKCYLDVTDALAYLRHLITDPIMDLPKDLMFIDDQTRLLARCQKALTAAYHEVPTVPDEAMDRYDAAARLELAALQKAIMRAIDRGTKKDKLSPGLTAHCYDAMEAVGEQAGAYLERIV